MDVPRLRSELLGWYDQHARDLPWRQNQDPYCVWISEVMLQQTRVETVKAYFARWIEAFPTVEALAAASEDQVLGQWSGLGYYRRARFLHSAAKAIVDAGSFPETVEDLQALPGIGAYTSGAIASIAFGLPVPAVDGNVVRVTARLLAEQGDPRDIIPRCRMEEAAAQFVDPERPGDWNQALMDLGATVCAQVPLCEVCPIALHCQARAGGLQATIPPPKSRKDVPVEHLNLAVIRDQGCVLLVRRPETGLLARTWMLPGGDPAAPLEDHVHAQTGIQVRTKGAPAEVEHRFTHRLWRMAIHEAVWQGGTLRGDARWVPEPELQRLGLSTAARKALATKPM